MKRYILTWFVFATVIIGIISAMIYCIFGVIGLAIYLIIAALGATPAAIKAYHILNRDK
ncbi:MAG: hypothetical protein NC131_19765 [Roseburia sp.]|nr:hypothetical protein [Roseburia sp.]